MKIKSISRTGQKSNTLPNFPIQIFRGNWRNLHPSNIIESFNFVLPKFSLKRKYYKLITNWNLLKRFKFECSSRFQFLRDGGKISQKSTHKISRRNLKNTKRKPTQESIKNGQRKPKKENETTTVSEKRKVLGGKEKIQNTEKKTFVDHAKFKCRRYFTRSRDAETDCVVFSPSQTCK